MLEVIPFHAIIGGTLLVDAVLFGFLIWAFHSERLGKYRMRDVMPVKVTKKAYWTNVLTNAVFSIGATLGLIYGLADILLTAEATPVLTIALQGVAILLVYDFSYYFMHRLFHIKRIMRLVHGVHHRARYPSALESLYLSKIEITAGLALLMVSTAFIALFGPVHFAAFGAAFFVYSTLNILVHSGMVFPHWFFAPLNVLAVKHHKHHMNEFGKNYSSLTPLPDFFFRTST